MNPHAKIYLLQNAIVKLFMDDEFEEWMKEYWYILEETEEIEQVIDLYLHDKYSPYYREKPEDYEDPFEVKRHAPITSTPDYKWD